MMPHLLSIVPPLLLGAMSVDADRPPPADPLTVTIHTEDADRFAALFAETKGSPTAEQLQRAYLDPASLAVPVFTPNRIGDAQRLAEAVANAPDDYSRAIAMCLPLVEQATADLRSIYLGLHGALPQAKLPQVYIVFGAGNSGGTAAPGAQVLGLEVLCRLSDEPEAFRRTLRHFFAHETVHSFQEDAGTEPLDDLLLNAVLAEGAADFIAQLVTGQEPDTARAAWARPREAELWRQFQTDLELTRALTERQYDSGGAAQEAFGRWVHNYGSAPDGWPGELGYWIGLRIWERYYAAAPDKGDALQEMLRLNDVRQILAIGKFRDP